MLVTLGSTQSIAGPGSQTYQYACNSAQQIYIRGEESTAATLENLFVTVQIGSTVVVNDISAFALSVLSAITGGGAHANANFGFKIDLGSHILDGEENLYVILRNDHASAALDTIDISAIVNEGGVYQPLKYTNYAESVFTDTNTLSVYAWANAYIDEDQTGFTVRNQSYSSVPTIASGCSVTQCNSWAESSAGQDAWKYVGTMAQNQVPLNTSINYSSTDVDGVVCVSAMDRMPSKAQSSRAQGQAVLSSMTSAERKAL
jgi:hypothetical protein